MSEQLLGNCVDGAAMKIRLGPSEDFSLVVLGACKLGKRFANAASSFHDKLACNFVFSDIKLVLYEWRDDCACGGLPIENVKSYWIIRGDG